MRPEARTAAGSQTPADIDSIRAHLDRGAPWEACDVFREAIAERQHDGELLYWGALAHARAGATQIAHALLDRADAERIAGAGHLVVEDAPAALASEIASLRGRLLKDAFHRAPERDGARQLAVRAREQYLKAYAIARDPHPGITAALRIPAIDRGQLSLVDHLLQLSKGHALQFDRRPGLRHAVASVIASAAKQSSLALNGLLRHFAPRNDGKENGHRDWRWQARGRPSCRGAGQ